MLKALLTVSGVTVSIAGHTLLTGVDLSVGEGEVVTVVGPSGCGKSSLLRAVAGLDAMAAGEVRLRGERPGSIGWPVFRRTVLLVDQHPSLLDDTVEANLRRPFTYRSAADRTFDLTLAERLLDELGVGRARMGQRARSLSVGQQDRVCLVRALLLEPAVLLLDEPTAALDGDAAWRVEQLLRERVRDAGLGLVIATHDRAWSDGLADRTVDLAPHMPVRSEVPADAAAGVQV